MLPVTTLLGLLAAAPAIQSDWTLERMVTREGGEVVFHHRPIPAALRNPWPAAAEAEFQKRAAGIIAAQAKLTGKGTTFFESEKRFYGYRMAHILGGRHEEALRALQAEDAQARDWHRHTRGIDYFACFTLKHQMRKYFYFGDLLESEYRRRMFEGAKLWTAQDPLRRPHHAYAKATGWGPNAKNSWVDVRSTENLFLMRVTSVYLMAEETGNAATAAVYRDKLLKYARTLYRVGIGEWDSENYHGHSIAPLLNLYDFAKDQEVRRAAKACLDWFAAAGAVKYLAGGFNGPGSRDYTHAQPFGGSAASILWGWFGDTPSPNTHWESDEVHLITSGYRPPWAVANLARKRFAKPVELFASKPHYSATTSFDAESPPAFLETQFIANTYQLGSLSCGTPPGVSAVNGFKLLVRDANLGSQILHAAPVEDPNFCGSPLYQKGKLNTENRVAQYRNLAIWLARDGRAPWLWVVPDSARVEHQQNLTLLDLGRTFVAIRPLGTSVFREDAEKTQAAREGKKARFAGHTVLFARGQSESFCGFAVEIGEPPEFENFAAFRAHVLQSKPDSAELQRGIVRLKTSDGKHLGFHWQDDPNDLGVWRNGTRHDWKRHASAIYRSNPADSESPIRADWGEGTLTVTAGGASFSGEVDGTGHTKFHNEPDADEKP